MNAKFTKFLLIASPLLVAAGCYSSRYPEMATVTSPPAKGIVVVPAPVSDRPVVRVYPEPLTPSTTLPPGVTATEHAIADSIRTTFNSDPDWKRITDQVEARVTGNRVVLRGVVANDAVRDQIEAKVKALPGVAYVDNGLTVLSR